MTILVGIVNSAVALGVRDLVTDAKVPLIIANAGANAITGDQRSDYVWRTSFTNSEVAGALGAYVARGELGDGKAFLSRPTTPPARRRRPGSGRPSRRPAARWPGPSSPPSAPPPTSSRTWPASSGRGPGRCTASTPGPRRSPSSSSTGSSGCHPRSRCTAAASSPRVHAALGIKGSLHYSDQLDNPANERFVAAYRAKLGESPTVYAVQAYNAAAVLDQALANGPAGDAIVEGLKGIGEVDSPRGPWRFNDGHGPDQVYYLRVTEKRDGRIVKVIFKYYPGATWRSRDATREAP